MAALNPSTERKFQIVYMLLKQLRDPAISSTASGAYYVVGEKALTFLTEAVQEAEQAFNS